MIGAGGGSQGLHPVVLDRRIGDFVKLALAALIPAALALAITIELPSGDLALTVGVIASAIGVVALMVSTRLEVTVAALAFYLLMLDGPVKLLLGAHELTAGIPNVLILAVCLGAVMRIIVRREPVTMPPLSAWVLSFAGIVVIESFNPNTNGILHIIGGYRQQLQWVPFFFFGYALMRSKKRFRQVFLIVGVAALANGLVSAYQTKLTPTQLASWGPGYHELIYPSHGTGRTYSAEGEARVRPPGLGSDEGFGGGVGVLALSFALALMATSRRRRWWVAVLICIGALIAIITGLGRLQLIGALLGLVAFVALAAIGGQRMLRTIATLLAIVLLAVPTGFVLSSVLRKGTLSRYTSIGLNESTTLHKGHALALIPRVLKSQPFGLGLGVQSAVANFGGRNPSVLGIGEGTSSETQLNFIVNELGAPGLILWVALSVYVMVLIASGMRHVADPELAIYLAGAMAPFFALFVEGTSGPLATSAAAGPYFWFAIGTAAYWFAGRGRATRFMKSALPRASPAVVGQAL